MKRSIAIVLLLSVCLGLLGCKPEQVQPEQEPEAAQEQYLFTDYQVPAVLQYPDYTFDHTPTTDELRQMAVQAMRDMLSVQWCVDRYFHYNKTSTGSGKDYTFIPENTYGGMPYTNADGCIVQWFEFYEPETGRLNIAGETQLINEYVGNTCAGCVCAAWQTVCTSISGGNSTGSMVPSNGFIPVGGYKSNTGISGFMSFGTDQILEMNGEETMYKAYAQILPADGLVSVVSTNTGSAHAIMAIETAHVVYDEDGQIDPEKSYVAIQDQRSGQGSSFYATEVDGQTIFCSGRLYYEYSFEALYADGYVPVTTAEFLGQKEYEAPQVTVLGDVSTAENAEVAYVSTTYPIAVAKMILVDNDGNETLVERIMLDKWDASSGLAYQFGLNMFTAEVDSSEFQSLLQEGKSYTLQYRVILSNAQIFTVAQIPV